MSWNESEHPRDDDGKFTDGNGGVKKTQWITSKRDYSNVIGVDNKSLQYDEESGTINLSKQEWAKYYKILGDEQHGDFVYHTHDGGRAVRLENKIVFDNGDFSKPKVNEVLSFVDNESLNDRLNDLVLKRFLL